MSSSTIKAADTDLTLDVLPACECCSYESVKWEDFLTQFPDNLPEPGKRVLLRIHEPEKTGMGLLLHEELLARSLPCLRWHDRRRAHGRLSAVPVDLR